MLCVAADACSDPKSNRPGDVPHAHHGRIDHMCVEVTHSRRQAQKKPLDNEIKRARRSPFDPCKAAPDQAEQLAQAVQRGGEISFALRSIADIEPEGPRGRTAAKDAERRPLVKWLKYGKTSSERVN